MLADRRLTEVEIRGGALKAAAIGHCHETAQRHDIQYLVHIWGSY
jgi:hypothetical protein